MILKDVSLNVNDKDKIGIIGVNGTGKSTLLKILADKEPSESGTILKSSGKKILYLPQNPELDRYKSIFEVVHEGLDAKKDDHQEYEVKAILTKLGIVDLNQSIATLSGGQLKRVALACVLMRESDCLLLDEPTNHLDMRSKDVLKDALREFDGTVIVVSHDREFLDGLVDKVYEFGNQKVVEHLGGIYNFLEHKKMDSLRELERSTGTSTSMSGTGEAQVSHNKLSYEARKELSKVIKKAEKAVAEAEARISELENGIAVIEAKLATPEGASDASLYGEYSALKKELSDAMDLWTERTMELEELNTQDS